MLLSLSTDGDKCAMINFLEGAGGDKQKSLILNFNTQKCEFCAQIQIKIYNLQSRKSGFSVSGTVEGRPSTKTPLLFAGASTP